MLAALGGANFPRVPSSDGVERALRPLRIDLLLAAVLTIGAQVELWTTDQLPDLNGPRKGWVALGLAVMTAAVAVRRRTPFLPVAVFAGGLVLLGLLVESPLDIYWMFIGLFVSVYSVAAHASWPLSAPGLALAVIAIEIGGDTDWLFGLVIFGAVWLAGYAVRSHRLLAEELARKNAELERERERGERLAMAEERARIAREVHDVLAHTVSVMVVQAEAAEELLDRDVGRTRQRLVAIETTGREALGEIRQLLGMLRDDGAEFERLPQPGLGQVEVLVGQFRDAGLTVTLTCEGEQDPLPPGLDLCAYRIVQEALTNTLKHAGPTAVTVTIRHGDNALDVDVEDDGPGAEGAEGGHGLLGIRERVGMYGGALSFGNRDKGGFGVHARLPHREGPE